MTYKDTLNGAMVELARDPLVRFVGYGLKNGGAWKHLPPEQIVESTVAENLMVGMATGMALAGLRPLVYLERFDFVLNAMDAIVNHLDKMAKISGGEFKPAVILRVVAGNRFKGLMTGATHTQDFTEAMRLMVDFPVVRLGEPHGTGVFAPALVDMQFAYLRAAERQREGVSTMIVEYKDLL